MTLLFWALEYTKVHIAYMILMFVWPAVLFRKYLKGKSLTFRLGFCSTTSILMINSVVLIFGLVGLLKAGVMRLLFYGSIAVSVYFAIPEKKKKLIHAGRVLAGSYGVKQLFHTFYEDTSAKRHEIIDRIRRRIEGHRGEYILLGIVLLYGMIYFTWGAFSDYSYGFGDMYPHNAWIYGLSNGEIFSAGVYPEGMHCFLYAMHTLFGIRVYSCLLFTAGVHILLFLLSAYAFLKEVFRSKYTPIFALTLFLTVDVLCIDEIYSMSRLQWTIPQEFGLFTLFLCGAFLLRYLRREKREIRFLRKMQSPFARWAKTWYFNDEIVVFAEALAASLVIHFYPTIMAFFICLAVVPFAVHKIFRPNRLMPLIAAVITGCVIAIIPMGLALASGIPFQGSIGWAVNVINGEDEGGNLMIDETTGEEITVFGGGKKKTEDKEAQPNSGSDGTGNESTGQGGAPQDNETPDSGDNVTENRAVYGDGAVSDGGTGHVTGTGSNAALPQPEVKVKEKMTFSKLVQKVKDKAQRLYWKCGNVYDFSYVTLYRTERAASIKKVTLFSLLLFLICKIGNIVYVCVTGRKDLGMCRFDGYFVLTAASIIYMTMYCAGYIGLPSLIAGSRLCSVSQLLICGVCMIPMDFGFWILGRISSKETVRSVACLMTLAIYLGVILTDNFHGFLYYELTRYNGAVMTTYAITKTMPKNSYTIVSTVDELYQNMEYGYHEELVQFINDCIDSDYTLPTEYVFLFYEKHPIEYAQSHFFRGPGWLAQEKYPKYYNSYVSQCPRISHATSSDELAIAPFYKYPISSQAYTELFSRTVLESRLHRWCMNFEKLYPNELHTYYEDEDFVCYYFRQNPACLYQLGFDKEKGYN